MLNEDYSKPFYMDNRMRRRIYGRDWDKVNPYLPALEPKADDSISDTVYLDKNNMLGEGGGRGEGRGYIIGVSEFNQLKGLVLYLQSKVNEHLDKSKKRRQPKF